MNLKTVVITFKGACVFFGSACITYQTVIGQWSNDTATPSGVQWSMIIVGSFGSGIVALGAWLSSTFTTYLKEQNGNGAHDPTPPAATPQGQT